MIITSAVKKGSNDGSQVGLFKNKSIVKMASVGNVLIEDEE